MQLSITTNAAFTPPPPHPFRPKVAYMYAWWHQAHVCMFFQEREKLVLLLRCSRVRVLPGPTTMLGTPIVLSFRPPVSLSLRGGGSEQKAFSHRGSSLFYVVRRIAVSHLQYVERLSPGNPKLGWRMHPACWQRRDATLIIPAFLCLAQKEARRSPWQRRGGSGVKV